MPCINKLRKSQVKKYKKEKIKTHGSLVYKTVQYENSSNVLDGGTIPELSSLFKVAVVQKSVQILQIVTGAVVEIWCVGEGGQLMWELRGGVELRFLTV